MDGLNSAAVLGGPAVVRDDDAVDAVPDGELGVFARASVYVASKHAVEGLTYQ